MEATLNFNKSLTINELAQVLRKQLPLADRKKLVFLLEEDETEFVPKEQFMADMKNAMAEVKLYKQGKLKLNSLEEFLNEL